MHVLFVVANFDEEKDFNITMSQIDSMRNSALDQGYNIIIGNPNYPIKQRVITIIEYDESCRNFINLMFANQFHLCDGELLKDTIEYYNDVEG